MKKPYILLTALLLLPMFLMAAPADRNRGYGEAFIFYEGGVEFAIFPDGQFDFFFSPRYSNYQSIRINPRSDFSFNLGRNYDPYVQYDDFGAVIQIAHVPVFYDHFGRIIQAGSVPIGYNFFGQVERIGNLILQYDQFQRLVGYSGFINVHNARYIPRPWHSYYTRPYSHAAVVYHRPYRQYYYVDRMDYDQYTRYYNNYDHDEFRRSYYRPGEKVVSYHRGRRTESPTDIRSERRASAQAEYSSVRSNQNARETSGFESGSRDVQREVRRSDDAFRSSGIERNDSRRIRVPQRERESVRSADPSPFPSANVQEARGRGQERQTIRSSGDSVRQPQAVSSRSRGSRGRE